MSFREELLHLINAAVWTLVIVFSLVLFFGCGREDERNIECAAYGCDEDESTRATSSPQPGPAGKPGPSGKPGTSGVDGTDCTVIQDPDGATIKCGDGTTAVVKNGAASLIYPIVPCKSIPRPYPEVLMCIDNIVYAVYGDVGTNKIHWVEVTPGHYQTTDGASCHFKVEPMCEVTDL